MVSHLIDKRNEVSFTATHNTQSHLPPTAEILIPIKNQVKLVPEQLKAGIRTMEIPLFEENNQLIAAHDVNEALNEFNKFSSSKSFFLLSPLLKRTILKALRK